MPAGLLWLLLLLLPLVVPICGTLVEPLSKFRRCHKQSAPDTSCRETRQLLLPLNLDLTLMQTLALPLALLRCACTPHPLLSLSLYHLSLFVAFSVALSLHQRREFMRHFAQSPSFAGHNLPPSIGECTNCVDMLTGGAQRASVPPRPLPSPPALLIPSSNAQTHLPIAGRAKCILLACNGAGCRSCACSSTSTSFFFYFSSFFFFFLLLSIFCKLQLN